MKEAQLGTHIDQMQRSIADKECINFTIKIQKDKKSSISNKNIWGVGVGGKALMSLPLNAPMG